MKTSDSNLQIQKVAHTTCADLYFIDNIVIVEFKRHSTIGKKELVPILDAIKLEFMTLIGIHYISNRTEVYSLKPTELTELKSRIDKFKSYSVITYGDADRTNLIFERMFLKKPIIRYESLEAAIEDVTTYGDTDSDASNVA